MKRLTIALLSLLCFSAYAQQTGLPTIQLSAAGKHISAEVASAPQQREIGLMFRKSIPQNGGMLFVFDRKETVCMWMKNTLIPLSVAFIEEDGSVLNIADMKPQTLDLHCSLLPIRYALEMNLGWFKKNGIKPGSKFTGLPAMHNQK